MRESFKKFVHSIMSSFCYLKKKEDKKDGILKKKM